MKKHVVYIILVLAAVVLTTTGCERFGVNADVVITDNGGYGTNTAFKVYFTSSQRYAYAGEVVVEFSQLGIRATTSSDGMVYVSVPENISKLKTHWEYYSEHGQFLLSQDYTLRVDRTGNPTLVRLNDED